MEKGMKVLRRVAAVGLAFALTGCGASGTSSQSTAEQGQDTRTEVAGEDIDTADLPTLRVAMTPPIASLPTEYTRKDKLDGKAGFEMDIIMFATEAPTNETLAADLWDVGAMGAAAVTGMANYDMMTISEVLESTDGLGVFVKPDSPIAQAKGYNPSYPSVLSDPETVEGATILPSIGTARYFTTLKQLEKLELGITDVNVVNMDTAQTYQTFQTNRCDTVALNVPTFFEAVDDSMVQADNLADLGTRHADMVVANRKAVEGKWELVQRCIDCAKKACRTFNDDLDIAANLMVDSLKNVGAEISRKSCVSDLGRVCFITAKDWKDREVDDFAGELDEFYTSLGQLEPELIDKFNSSIVSDFAKSRN